MGLLDGLLGNASEVAAATVEQEYKQLLLDGERVHLAYNLIRDSFFFTDKRLVVIDRQGVTGKKVSFISIPYRSITRFGVETAGHLDRDAELVIWVVGRAEPIQFQFTRAVNIYYAHAVLAGFVTR